MKHWRDAASIILAAKSKSTRFSTSFNYKLLTLKRHKDSSFLPEKYVFPGGVVEKADGDLKWKKLYQKYSYDEKNFAGLFPSKASGRPPIFESSADELPRELSLRIAAIRETFEECGVLICRPFLRKNCFFNWAKPYIFPLDEVKDWQRKVHNDPLEFYEMCREMQVLPDVWTLHEWSNWLTPAFFQSRFDTVFFMACTNFLPDAHFDEKEMEDLRWEQPNEMKSELTIAPPQFFELTRISQFLTIEDLLNSAMESHQRGSHLTFPVRAALADGVVFLLPGDSLYPKDQINLADMKDLQMLDMTIEEFSKKSGRKNRMELSKSGLKVLSDFSNVDADFLLKNIKTNTEVKV